MLSKRMDTPSNEPIGCAGAAVAVVAATPTRPANVTASTATPAMSRLRIS